MIVHSLSIKMVLGSQYWEAREEDGLSRSRSALRRTSTRFVLKLSACAKVVHVARAKSVIGAVLRPVRGFFRVPWRLRARTVGLRCSLSRIHLTYQVKNTSIGSLRLIFSTITAEARDLVALAGGHLGDVHCGQW